MILAAVHGVNADVQALKTNVQRLETRMTSLEGKVERLESRVEGQEGEVVQLKNGMGSLEQKTTRINVILENEIRVNIQRVAEGHLDLVKNLQDAMKHSNEVEMLAVRTNIKAMKHGLESDVKELKQKVS